MAKQTKISFPDLKIKTLFSYAKPIKYIQVTIYICTPRNEFMRSVIVPPCSMTIIDHHILPLGEKGLRTTTFRVINTHPSKVELCNN